MQRDADFSSNIVIISSVINQKVNRRFLLLFTNFIRSVRSNTNDTRIRFRRGHRNFYSHRATFDVLSKITEEKSKTRTDDLLFPVKKERRMCTNIFLFCPVSSSQPPPSLPYPTLLHSFFFVSFYRNEARIARIRLAPGQLSQRWYWSIVVRLFARRSFPQMEHGTGNWKIHSRFLESEEMSLVKVTGRISTRESIFQQKNLGRALTDENTFFFFLIPEKKQATMSRNNFFLLFLVSGNLIVRI